MKTTKLPNAIKWIAPVIIERRKLTHISQLSQESRKLVSKKMTGEMFTEIDDWIDNNDSAESKELMMSLIDLGSLDLFELPDPDLSYEGLLKGLRFSNPGRKIRSLREIGELHVPTLVSHEKEKLVKVLWNLLRSSPPSVKFSCYQILLQIAPDSNETIRGIRELIDEEVSTKSKKSVIGRCIELLLCNSYAHSSDIERAQQLLFDTTIDLDLNGPAILAGLLKCKEFAGGQKVAIVERAKKLGSWDIDCLIEDWEQGEPI